MFNKVSMLWVLFSTLFCLSSSAIARPIDMIAATVGEEVITLGEVVTETKIKAILRASDASVSLPVPGVFNREALDTIINRMLVAREAAKFLTEKGGGGSLDELLAFERKFADSGELILFLSQEGLTAEALARRFASERDAAAFIYEKIALSVHVTVSEVEAFYVANETLFSGKERSEAEAEIRAMLLNKKSGQFLEEWLEKLRARGKIKYFKLPAFQEPE